MRFNVTGTIALLVCIGLITGLAVSSTEPFNGSRSRAEAERIRLETEIQAQRATIELQAYQREQELRTRALEQRLADERAYRLALQEATLFVLRVGGTALLIAVSIAVLVLAAAVAFRLVVQARSIRPQPSTQVPIPREQVRRLARENERLARRLALLEGVGLTEGGNGHMRERL